MSHVAEVQAALLVAFNGRIAEAYSLTREATGGSATVWRLQTPPNKRQPSGMIMSVTAHHWAAAGAALGCWIAKLERPGDITNLHWRVLSWLYPAGFLKLDQYRSELVIQRREVDSPSGRFVMTPHSINEATMPQGLIDPFITYIRQQVGIEPISAVEYVALACGQLKLPTAPIPELVIERPDYEAFEAAIAEAERLTS